MKDFLIRKVLIFVAPVTVLMKKKFFFLVNRKRFAFFIRLPFIDFGDFPAIKGFF